MHLRFSAAKHIEHRMSVSIPRSITNHIFPAASCVACCLPPFLLVLFAVVFFGVSPKRWLARPPLSD
jgi:hypothetical protein